jgi:hypothetical protein
MPPAPNRVAPSLDRLTLWRALCRWLALAALSVGCAAHAQPSPNYMGLWWAEPAGSESGWGINLTHHGDVIFATWFTYDRSGRAWWLSMSAVRAGDRTYSGELIQTAGPPFSAQPFDPARVTRTPVGAGTLDFTDAGSGTFTYRVDGVQGVKSLVRQSFGPAPACVAMPMPNYDAAANYQDLWWIADGAESGWGINFAHQGDVIFAHGLPTTSTAGRSGCPPQRCDRVRAVFTAAISCVRQVRVSIASIRRRCSGSRSVPRRSRSPTETMRRLRTR